jgi:hypothetical protein
LKAKERVRMPRTVQGIRVSREEWLEERRSYNKFARQMKPYVKEIRTDQRDALLAEVYRLANFKQMLDWWAETERADAARYRKYRLWLVDVDTRLQRAISEIEKALYSYPTGDQSRLAKLTIGKAGATLLRTGERLAKTIRTVEVIQRVLAHLINPPLRTSKERKVVRDDPDANPKPLEHPDLPLRKKTKQIDLWLIRSVAFALGKYQNKNGEPIPRRDQIIARIFEFALGEARTEGSIGKVLSPSRQQRPRQLC